MRYLVIHHHKDRYTITVMCKFFEVSRSGYYDYVKRMNEPAFDEPLAQKIAECQRLTNRTYGYRRVQMWLERQGVYRNPKTVFLTADSLLSNLLPLSFLTLAGVLFLLPTLVLAALHTDMLLLTSVFELWFKNGRFAVFITVNLYHKTHQKLFTF